MTYLFLRRRLQSTRNAGSSLVISHFSEPFLAVAVIVRPFCLLFEPILGIKMSKVDEVKLKISENKVVVYSKTYCPFCTKAKTALADAGLKDYVLIELDNLDDGDAFQDALQQITGGRTVPRVFIGGKFVGGGSEMENFQKEGKLKPMLKEAGAL